MKKKLLLLLTLTVCFILSLAAFAACGESDSTGSNQGDTDNPALLNFTDVTFENVTVDYDGNPHSLEVKGAPNDTTVTYSAERTHTDAGSYAVTATLEKTGYNKKSLAATLTINKITLPQNYANSIEESISLEDSTIEYDGTAHTAQVVGNMPSIVEEVIYYYNDEQLAGVTSPGTYSVKVVFRFRNYSDYAFTKTSTLKIKSTEEQLYTAILGDTVYFQNPLDGNKLYSYSPKTSGITLKNHDKSLFFTSDGTKLYYASKGLLKSNVKSIDGSGLIKTVNDETAEYLTVNDGYLYYSVNSTNPLSSKNGIYRFPLNMSGEDYLPEKIMSGKASWLCVYNNTIYFAAGTTNIVGDVTGGIDKGKLMKVSAIRKAAQGENDYTGATIVYESSNLSNTVSDMILDNGTLYFNVRGGTKGSALYRLNVGNNEVIPVKMTTDSGKNLAVIGNDLYYINIDWATSNIFGKGIYKVSKTSSSSNVGTKVIDGTLSSLSANSGYLYYYKLENKHFYRYEISSKAETDLMKNFTPIDTTTVKAYARTREYNGEIWYINPRDDGAIYKYNPKSKQNYKVIPDSCADFWFDGKGNVWYSSYIATNYNCYKMNLESGETVRFSKERCDSFVFTDNYIYYIDNGVNANNIRRVASNAENDDAAIELQFNGKKPNVHFLSLEVVNNKLYFCTNPSVGYKKFCYADLSDIDESGNTPAKMIEVENGNIVACAKGVICFSETDKSLQLFNASTSKAPKLKSDVEIEELVTDGEWIYYVDGTSGKEGVYKISVNGGAATKIFTGKAHGLAITSIGLTFIEKKVTFPKGSNDYPDLTDSSGNIGNGYLYVYDGTNAKKLN